MLKNFFIIALRNLLRQKLHSLITIAGLTIALSVSGLIFMFIIHELSYDNYHQQAGNIYRIAIEGETSGQPFRFAVTPAPLAPALEKKLPSVIAATRFFYSSPTVYFTYNDKEFYEEDILYADSCFTNVFSFETIEGNISEALSTPYTIIITDEIARKYFVAENPIGKKLKWNNKDEYTIGGIIRKPPSNSHFRFNFIVSFPTLRHTPHAKWLENWTSMTYYSYIKIQEHYNPEQIQSDISAIIQETVGEELAGHGVFLEPSLQPLTNIHLYSNIQAEIEPNNYKFNVNLLLFLAVFILLIAGINFMNLATAHSAYRAKEVGMRKVAGANKKMLIRQFLGESVFISLTALIIALFLIELLLPVFNSLINKDIEIRILHTPLLLVGFIGSGLLFGLFSGSLPALYLSSLEPVDVIRNMFRYGIKGKYLRNILVIFQFSVSVILIICTLIIYKQIQFCQQKNPGFSRQNLIVVPIRNHKYQEHYEELKSRLKKIPGIISISASTGVPGGSIDGRSYTPEGSENNKSRLIYGYAVDFDYITTMQMEIEVGRDFIDKQPSDEYSVLINETLRQQLGWEKPVGKYITNIYENEENRIEFKVIGVIKDFHTQSLRSKILPLIIRLNNEPAGYLTIRLSPDNHKQTIEKIDEEWHKAGSSLPFDYYFLETAFNKLYKAEKRLWRIFIYLTCFTVFIASMGLFGLASFIAEKRTREIGIRKALGAESTDVFILMLKDISKWMAAANLLAWPFAYILMKRWLQSFEYKIDMDIGVFLTAAILSFVLAFISTNYQSVKAALVNPADAIKYE